MSRPLPPAAAGVLARFGLDEIDDRLGIGGESWVYALDAQRILRLPRSPAVATAMVRKQRFLNEIDGRLPFVTPIILEIGREDRYTIETRVPGRPMTEVLPELGGASRRTALSNYLSAAAAMADVTFDARPYGYLLADAPLVATDWPAFIDLSLKRYLDRNCAAIDSLVGQVDDLAKKAMALMAAVPRKPPRALVHGDFFPGNVMMADDLGVSGVVDFSTFTVVGDPLFDIAGAVIFPEMIDICAPDDWAQLQSLAAGRYGPAVAPVLAAYRAYFAIALADASDDDSLYPGLAPWAVRALRQLAGGRSWP